MARKRLIKGANAARVEERIARVPEDLGSQPTIFHALKVLESPEAARKTARKAPRPTSKAAPKARSKAAPKAPRPAPKAELEAALEAAHAAAPRTRGSAHKTPSPIKTETPVMPEPATAPAVQTLRRIGPSDFSAAEREAIVRCCSDYRNRLPIYLLAVQREVEIIDSVIQKCVRVDGRRAKR